MTYESLRISPDGKHFSFFDGEWQDPENLNVSWSDVIIFAMPVATEMQ
jgi:hypothetical protein